MSMQGHRNFALVLTLCSALSVSGAATAAAESLSVRVDAAVRQQMHEQQIPGLSLAVVREGKIIKSSGYGFADLEQKVPATAETIFEAGSITKQFTASAVMMLADDGRLGLDDSLATFFPEVPPSWRPITIRQVLSHTAGIPDYWGDSEQTYYSKGVIDFRREYSDDELTRAYFSQSLDFMPGAQWRYSSSGYNLLGILIHRLTDKTYGQFLRERILQPLHMNATSVFSWNDIVAGRARGYDLVDGVWKNTATWMSQSVMSGADGGLLTNVLDLAKWDAALYSDQILKRNAREAMWMPLRRDSGSASASGLGWFIADARGHRVVYHTGGGFGFYADISRYVDDHLTIIVMTNVDETHTDVLKVVAAVAEIYLPSTAGGNPVKDW